MSVFPYLFRCGAFLCVVLVIVGLVFAQLVSAVQANPMFNATILGVLLIGGLYSLRQVVMLVPEIRWLDSMRRPSRLVEEVRDDSIEPRLLAPLARILSESEGRLRLSPQSIRSLLDGLRSRVDESHEITRYTIGLLVFLGLLGTFWGLLETVRAVGDTVSSLDFSTQSDPIALFSRFQESLRTPLSGMGTAFSSSLFGLAGALILGFFELQAGQAHNRFINSLEEWLSTATRAASFEHIADKTSIPAYTQALLEQTAENLDRLEMVFDKSSRNLAKLLETIDKNVDNRQALQRSLHNLGQHIETLGTRLFDQKDLLHIAGDAQKKLTAFLEKQALVNSDARAQEQSRYLQKLDHCVGAILNEVRHGHRTTAETLRQENRLLARTFARLFSGSSSSPSSPSSSGGRVGDGHPRKGS